MVEIVNKSQIESSAPKQAGIGGFMRKADTELILFYYRGNYRGTNHENAGCNQEEML